jgi:hypothetical protein
MSLIDDYYLRDAAREEISLVYEKFIYPFFGNNVIPLNTAIQIHEINQSVLQLLMKNSNASDSENIAGIISLLSLNSTATELILEGFLTGSMLQPEHIVPCNELAFSVYLAIGIVDKNKKEASSSLIVHTSKIVRKFPLVLLNPVTDEGLKLAKYYGATPVYPHEIYQLGILHVWQNGSCVPIKSG